MGRHNIARNQGILREVDREAETGETFQDIIQFLKTPVSLVLMALDPDGADRNTRFQQAFQQDLIGNIPAVLHDAPQAGIGI